jgi:mRNA interferase RelE/StbE
MAEYKINFKESVEKDLRTIPREDIIRIFNRIKSLSKNPRPSGCEKLTGQERYRLRQGRYRILYSIQNKELSVWVIKIGHRKDIYR